MKSPYLAISLVLPVLAACGGGGDGGGVNPRTLWLANDQVETRVHLIDFEPPPF